MKKKRVYLSLGGNKGQVLLCLKKALYCLSKQPQVTTLQVSHFYQTAPVQMNHSAWFINAVCSFDTCLALKDVFEMTQRIEFKLGKVKKPKNAARPIDIDLLFYGDQICQEEELEIPHPCWKERLFVLIPLADLIKEVLLCGHEGVEHYILIELIQSLILHSSQTVYLLEKNPTLQ